MGDTYRPLPPSYAAGLCALAASRLLLAGVLFLHAYQAAGLESETARAGRYALVTLIGLCGYAVLSAAETLVRAFPHEAGAGVAPRGRGETGLPAARAAAGDFRTAARAALVGAPEPGSWWRHYKGGEYAVLACSVTEDTLEPLVTYTAAGYGFAVTRGLSAWGETVVDGSGLSVPRFRRVPEE